MNTFFKDENYKMPITSNYMKLLEGSNKFRVLGSSIVGYEYFNNENKPVRSREPFDETPDMKKDGRVNHFWFFPVWNYAADKVQLLEITQKSIQGQMKDYIDSPDWGSPFDYDFQINRKGTSKMDTEYKVIALPHKPLDEEIKKKYEDMEINLEMLFLGKDPFAK